MILYCLLLKLSSCLAKSKFMNVKMKGGNIWEINQKKL